jgi:hypothetical protein
MWNITQPLVSTTPSGRTTATSAKPASWSRTVGSIRRPSPTATAVASVASATAAASAITA